MNTTSEAQVNESELASLQAIFKTTVDEGHALHKCDDADQAQRWSDFLNQHLPEGREYFVIRGREVNSYSISGP